jgi:transcriptional antiterminator RfaH
LFRWANGYIFSTFDREKNEFQMIDFKKRWYAIYTKSRAEKKAAEILERNGIEVYLPLQKTIRQWSDRRKMVYVPLFRSYVFVNVKQKEFYSVLNTPGVVRFVTIGHEKIAIPECQIDAIRAYLGEIQIDEPLSYFEKGSEVEVVYGALRGLKGILISDKNQKKLIVQINAIYQNITLTLASHLLKRISPQGK